jgi:hypothetical protein
MRIDKQHSSEHARIAEAYMHMATEAHYRPQAPSDGERCLTLAISPSPLWLGSAQPPGWGGAQAAKGIQRGRCIVSLHHAKRHCET